MAITGLHAQDYQRYPSALKRCMAHSQDYGKGRTEHPADEFRKQEQRTHLIGLRAFFGDSTRTGIAELRHTARYTPGLTIGNEETGSARMFWFLSLSEHTCLFIYS